MLIHCVRKLTVVAVVYACSLAALQQQVIAGDGPVLRTFGFLATGTAAPPNYLADDSRILTVLPDAADDTGDLALEFTSNESDYFDENGDRLPHADLFDTRWVRRPAHHSVKGGEKDEGGYFWLESEETPTAPAAGAHAFSGPDGSIVHVAEYRIAQCAGGPSASCSSGDVSAGRWHVVGGTGGKRFLVVTAWFSR